MLWDPKATFFALSIGEGGGESDMSIMDDCLLSFLCLNFVRGGDVRSTIDASLFTPPDVLLDVDTKDEGSGLGNFELDATGILGFTSTSSSFTSGPSCRLYTENLDQIPLPASASTCSLTPSGGVGDRKSVRTVGSALTLPNIGCGLFASVRSVDSTFTRERIG